MQIASPLPFSVPEILPADSPKGSLPPRSPHHRFLSLPGGFLLAGRDPRRTLVGLRRWAADPHFYLDLRSPLDANFEAYFRASPFAAGRADGRFNLWRSRRAELCDSDVSPYLPTTGLPKQPPGGQPTEDQRGLGQVRLPVPPTGQRSLRLQELEL